MGLNSEIKQNSFFQDPLHKGIGYITLSAFMIACFGLFAKLGVSECSVPVMIFFRFSIPFSFVSIFWLLKKQKEKLHLTPSEVKSQLIRALFMTFTQLNFLVYLSAAPVFNAIMLWNTGPVFIPFIAWAFYKQRISKMTWLCTFIGLIGVALILKPDNQLLDSMSIFGLFAGIGMAFSQVIYGINAKTTKLFLNVFYTFLFSTIFSAILLLFSIFALAHEPKLCAGGTPFWQIALVFLSFGISSIGNQVLRGKAYQYARPVSLSPFLYSVVLFSAFFQWILYKQLPDGLVIVGSLLIILSSFIKWAHSFRSRKKFIDNPSRNKRY